MKREKYDFRRCIFVEIELKEGTYRELAEICWDKFGMYEQFPDEKRRDEKVNLGAFDDWFYDLSWIKQKNIVVVIHGKMFEDLKRELLEISDDFQEAYDEDINDEQRKLMHFIIA